MLGWPEQDLQYAWGWIIKQIWYTEVNDTWFQRLDGVVNDCSDQHVSICGVIFYSFYFVFIIIIFSISLSDSITVH